MTWAKRLLRAIPLPGPAAPPYDVLDWETRPWPERVQMVCRAWAIQGYGAPLWVYAAYVVKIALVYVGGWALWCVWPVAEWSLSNPAAWAMSEVAFQKAVLWSLLYESLGLGCGSGPLTGRYMPPVGGPLYWLRPGTLKRPPFPGVPGLGGDERTVFDVGLYAAHIGWAGFVLAQPTVEPAYVWGTVGLLLVIGLSDKTIFLAARAEHYGTTLVCIALVEHWIAAAMAVQLALWFWAATSKLNRHFPAVIGVMLSNHPLMRLQSVRKLAYKSYPDDLRPSGLAAAAAHFGTVVEYTFPVLIVVGQGGTLTWAGLMVMLAFHIFITSNFPMAVPIEWNVMMVYSAFCLFWFHSQAHVSQLVDAPVTLVFLLLMLVVVPVLGNFFPHRFSFLLSMRYYAGNWAYSAWLFTPGTRQKLGAVKVSAPDLMDQLDLFYDEATAKGMVSKVLAFRHMHLHGRALHELVGKAVPRIEDVEYFDGELIAGWALGWNFGEGHLHDHGLLQAIQRRCDFAPGELRCIFVESQPLFSGRLPWRIWDAADGEIERGVVEVKDLLERQPWPGPVVPPA